MNGDTVKYLRNVIVIVLFCIGSSLVAYPLLHETGHYVGAKLMGIKVAEFVIYPHPHVSFEVNNAGGVAVLFIAVCGVLLPLTVAGSISKRHICLWSVRMALIITNITVVTSSIISVFLYCFGIVVEFDDMVTVLILYPEFIYVVLFFLVLQELIMVYILINHISMDRVFEFLYIKKE